MQDNFDIQFRGDHISIKHAEGFTVTPEGMEKFWQFLSDLCEQYNCTRVLAEGPPPIRQMDTVDAFQSGVQAAGVAPGFWLALCFSGYEPDELSELFVRAARNRGVHVKFFSNREQALRWLGAFSDDAVPVKKDLHRSTDF